MFNFFVLLASVFILGVAVTDWHRLRDHNSRTFLWLVIVIVVLSVVTYLQYPFLGNHPTLKLLVRALHFAVALWVVYRLLKDFKTL